MATQTKAQLEATVAKLQGELAIEANQAQYYQEAYSDSARMLLENDNIGWDKLGASVGDVANITLAEAKRVSKRLHGFAESNPLLTRGREIRNSYLFSDMYEVGTEDAKTKITPQMWTHIKKQRNHDAVFSLEALERIESERFCAGNAFVVYDRIAKSFQQISFQEIGDIIYNPDDATEIWYVQREWSAMVITTEGKTQVVNHKEYYPASRYAPDDNFAPSINGIVVDTNKRMIVERVGVQPGGNLGIPDSFAAAPWALAYSAYLSDGSKVLAALAEWAWLVKPTKRNSAERAASSVRSDRGAGGTLITDMEVSAMPSKDAVDLNTGRPIAAQVAAALGVSIVLLLADPGQSGAYGTAQTLSDPNRRTMETRRQRNTIFLNHCLELLGVKSPQVTWPKMAPGTDMDEVTLVNMAFGTGMFHEDEIRPRLAELAHVTLLHDDVPDGFMYPNNSNSLPRKDIDADGSGTSAKDGTNEMVNGQGKNNLSLGNISHRAGDKRTDS